MEKSRLSQVEQPFTLPNKKYNWDVKITCQACKLILFQLPYFWELARALQYCNPIVLTIFSLRMLFLFLYNSFPYLLLCFSVMRAVERVTPFSNSFPPAGKGNNYHNPQEALQFAESIPTLKILTTPNPFCILYIFSLRISDNLNCILPMRNGLSTWVHCRRNVCKWMFA